MDSLYVLDGHSMIHRAFHAPMDIELTSPTGEPTKAIFLFIRDLLRLLQRHKPTYLAMCLDGPRDGTFRRQLDPRYKATRAESEPDLHSQIKRIHHIVNLMGIATFINPEFEADDLIGTLINRRDFFEMKRVIISRDTDLHQLLKSDEVVMYDPMSDQWFDETYATKRWGVSVDCISFVKALCGDTSDNIIGLAGVGPKTAAKLVDQYKVPSNLIRCLTLLKPTVQEAWAASKFDLLRNLKLATIRTDVRFEPGSLSLQRLDTRSINLHGAAVVFEELGLRRWADASYSPKTTETSESPQAEA